MIYEYKCVAAPPISPFGGSSTGEIVRQYEHVINDVASGGWEFVGIETIARPDDLSFFAMLKRRARLVTRSARTSSDMHASGAMKIMVFRKEDIFHKEDFYRRDDHYSTG